MEDKKLTKAQEEVISRIRNILQEAGLSASLSKTTEFVERDVYDPKELSQKMAGV